MKNICYVGTLAALLDIDMDVIAGMLSEKFGKKPALMESNRKAIQLGYDYAKKHLDCPLPIKLEKHGRDARLDPDRRQHGDGARLRLRGRHRRRVVPHHAVDQRARRLQVLLREVPDGQGDGPAPLLHPAGRGRARRHRHGDRRGVERGARLHLDLGPGHLADERAASASRTTPRSPRSSSTCSASGRRPACPRAPSRATSWPRAYASHGDTKHIVLFPANPAECFDFAGHAFDLAERFQTPVFMLTRPRHRDERLGRARASSGTTAYRPDRGKVLTERGDRGAAQVPPLLARGRARRRGAHAAGRATRRAPSSPAARATTSSAATPRSPTSTRR